MIFSTLVKKNKQAYGPDVGTTTSAASSETYPHYEQPKDKSL
jgi:hypothetical protein